MNGTTERTSRCRRRSCSSSMIILSLVSCRHKQHQDLFDVAIETFINKISSANKHDFGLILNALESKTDRLDRLRINGVDLDATYSLCPEVPKQLSQLSEECHQFSFDVVFLPIKSLLHGFDKLPVRECFCIVLMLTIIVFLSFTAVGE